MASPRKELPTDRIDDPALATHAAVKEPDPEVKNPVTSTATIANRLNGVKVARDAAVVLGVLGVVELYHGDYGASLALATASAMFGVRGAKAYGYKQTYEAAQATCSSIAEKTSALVNLFGTLINSVRAQPEPVKPKLA